MVWYNKNMKIEKNRGNFASKITILLIIVGVLVAGASIIFTRLYSDNFFAEKKFEELSRKYYEEKIYTDFISEHNGEDIAEAFSKLDNGTITVKLRQILNYEFLEHDANYRGVFETDVFSCDTNNSKAIFTPRSPFGRKDYEVEFQLECEKK